MNLEIKKKGKVAVVKYMDTRLDTSVIPAFKEQINNLIDEGNHFIVLNLSKVGFMDSSGLGSVVSIRKKIRAEGDGDLTICELKNNVKDLFNLTRMDRKIKIYTSEDEAVKALS
ncbi:STAS domain-containing protein [Desulfococcaceae bacterium HSG7]|nr:STAS domain-containing protein [Desulfococcaceae bacterium HSG9]MDM8557007.1 STAS domain-containing protein [Desulfococcaceae bacterium HSG7]